MNDFQQKVIDILAGHFPVWLVGGMVRDRILGREAEDLDIVCVSEPERMAAILQEHGYMPLKIGAEFKTFSLFNGPSRIDIVLAADLKQDALHRDFTINSIYMNPLTGEIFDPLNGRKDLKAGILRACGDPESRFREDPQRILRLVKFAVKLEMEIEQATWKPAKNLIPLLSSTSKERITAELAEILSLAETEKAVKGVRMLEKIGYWDFFVPELARLKGIVQNRYHTLDVWEHTLAVFGNTPGDLFLRLAALFHDIGKWETAGNEYYLGGKLTFSGENFQIDNYKISASYGEKGVDKKLRPFLGKTVNILGVRPDHFPETIQFKRVVAGELHRQGLTRVPDGKRHFLNHEQVGAKLLKKILKRYSFAMFFQGGGQKREHALVKLVENHLSATLAFGPEFRGERSRRSLRDRAAGLVWKICWEGRGFELQNIYDFVVLWKADYEAGKVYDERLKQVFEKIQRELISTALWQKENLENRQPEPDQLFFKKSWIEFSEKDKG